MRKELIEKKLKEIEESISLIKKNLPESLEEFVWLGLVKDGIYRRISLAAERVMNICAIINFDLNLEVPHSEMGIIENIANKGVISEDMKQKIKEIIDLRNDIIRNYETLKDDEAFEKIKKVIDYFDEFATQIRKFLSQ